MDVSDNNPSYFISQDSLRKPLEDLVLQSMRRKPGNTKNEESEVDESILSCSKSVNSSLSLMPDGPFGSMFNREEDLEESKATNL